jgi:exo-1,4-beta-D-glucosaminidase
LHADGEVGRNLIVYTKALEARYGPAKDVTDYAEKSQLMAYEAERAMFEAYGRNKYISTGVIQWMLNNAWPSVVWHLFDYYLRPGGGYFGTKKACEPLHVQYSYDDQSVVVVNSFNRPWSGLIVEANVYNIDLTRKFSSIKSVSVGEDSSTKALVIPKLEGLTPTYFVNLTLRDAEGKLQSTNFYWLSTKPDVLDWNSPRRYYTPEKFYADFTELQSLPKITLKVESSTEDQGQDDVTRVTLTNPSSSLAFFVHLRVLRSSDGTEVLPALWQDNYIELMPSEKKQIQAVYAQKYLCGAAPIVAVDGWNVATTKQASILQ